jgi:very-short-patch-repair endonuclease
VGTVSVPSDSDLARLAGRLRVLRLAELRAAGLSENAIRHRVAQGRLQRLWPGVYVVGPDPVGPLSLAHGATEALGGAAYATNGWGCFVHDFAKPPPMPVEILVVSGTRHARDGIRIHRSRNLLARDVGHARGIAVVSPARAILGCAETSSLIQLEALIADAFAARKVTDHALDELAQRAGPTPAARKLRLLRQEGVQLTRSEAERILRRLLNQAGLPQPETNYPIGRYFADFAWPHVKLVVEFDGFATHGHKQAFTPDRIRGGKITVRGWSVMHVTWDELIDEPLAVVARIAGALAVREAG